MKYIFYFIFLTIFISCGKSSALKKDFSCNYSINLNNTKDVNDVRGLFTMQLPKGWKTNLYYDNSLSSIYAADTTVNLTQSVLLDASIIHAPIQLDDSFKEKIKNDNNRMQLKELKSKDIKLFDKTSYYNLSKGKKGKYPYHILNVFTKVNSDNFIHIKTEIYGDSLVNERLCKAINIIEKTHVK